MDNYQKFVKTFLYFRKRFQEMGNDGLDLHHKISKKKFYDAVGMTDEQEIKRYEHEKSKTMNDRVDLGLGLVEQYGSVYMMDEVVRRYILLNDPPKNKLFLKKLTLPFSSMFIETKITKEDADIGVDTISGIMIMELPTVVVGENKVVGRSFIVYYLCEEVKNDGYYTFIDEFTIDYDNPNIFYDDHKTLRFLKKFIANVLLFFNDREVDWVSVKRSDKNKERRIKEKKMPLPDHRVVRLTGRLKRYIESVTTSLSRGKLQYSFWVRGHWKLLQSDFYKAKKNQWIKIEPFEKGKGGIKIKRSYELKFDKDDERKDQVEKDVYFDDIKPLDKPLRKMRDPSTGRVVK